MALKEILVMVLAGCAMLGRAGRVGHQHVILSVLVLPLSSPAIVPELATRAEVLVTTMPIVRAPRPPTETLLELKRLPVMISVAAGVTRHGREMRGSVCVNVSFNRHRTNQRNCYPGCTISPLV